MRYHGVLDPNAAWRAEIVAQAPAAGGLRRPTAGCVKSAPTSAATPRPRRLPWAELLKRSFAVDILRCARCGGPRQVLAVVMSPEPVRAILSHLGLDTVARPRPPPTQLDLC